jgi:hypothetical protein
MRKSNAPEVSPENGATIKIGRFNEATRTLVVPQDSTIADVLIQANITLTASETCYIGGVIASPLDVVDDGDLLQVIGQKEAGNR